MPFTDCKMGKIKIAVLQSTTTAIEFYRKKKYYFAKCEYSSLKLSAFLHNPIKTKFSILLPYTTTVIDIYFSSDNTLVSYYYPKI